MKHSVKLELNNKNVELCFSISELAKMEKAINKSLFTVMVSDITRTMDIDFTLAGLAYGLTPNISLDEAADLLQEHCDNGGTIYEVSNAVLNAVMATGLYSQGEVKKKSPAQ